MKNLVTGLLSICVVCSGVFAQTPIGTESYQLLASDGASFDLFGYNVAVSGDTAIVGSFGDDDNGSNSGSAYVYRFDGTTWVEETKLYASDGASQDNFGHSVSISGSIAIVGAYGDDNTGTDYGAAYIYRFDGTNWIEETKLLANDGTWGDAFGFSVSISGNTAVIGAYHEDDNGIDSGAVYVFTFNGKQWVQEAKLLASDGAPDNLFGKSVCISGNTVIVGALYGIGWGYFRGAVYFYRFDGNAWNEEEKVFPSTNNSASFSSSVSLSGDVAVASGNKAYIYRFDGTTWIEEHLIPYNATSVSISGNSVVVGVQYDEDNGSGAGASYLYRFDGEVWNEDLKLLASNGAVNDWLGWSVSIDGNNAIAGAYGTDDNGSNSGSTYVFNFIADNDGDGIADSVDNCHLYNPDQLDCNGNGIGDVCDIADGTSIDCDVNGVPDDCQSDCNQNGIADACDIANGNELDCDVNGIPDSCDLAEYFQEEANLLPSGEESFGSNVSISGNTAVIGSFIYRFDGTTWIEEFQLPPFGSSAFIHNDVVILGMKSDSDNGSQAGAAYIYRFDGTTWFEEAKLLATDGQIGDHFGYSVCMYGNSAVIGANRDDDNGDNSGSAYLFQFDGSTWVQTRKILPSDGSSGDYFGLSISMFGDTVMVGAPVSFGLNGAGAVYVYSINDSGCIEEAIIYPSDGQLNDLFGASISISGDTTIFGAWQDDDNGFASGSAYIFRSNGCTWIEEAKLLASDGSDYNHFGRTVSISGGTAIVGRSLMYSSAIGAAYIYTYDGNSWFEQTKLTASDGASGDQFGENVTISGDNIFVMAPGNDDNGDQTGSAYFFRRATPLEQGDCNSNSVPDICELEDPLTDQNNNGILDECECFGDTNGDGFVNVIDLLSVVDQWGQTNAPVDFNGDGIVNVSDLLILIDQWGACQ